MAALVVTSASVIVDLKSSTSSYQVLTLVTGDKTLGFLSLSVAKNEFAVFPNQPGSVARFGREQLQPFDRKPVSQ